MPPILLNPYAFDDLITGRQTYFVVTREKPLPADFGETIRFKEIGWDGHFTGRTACRGFEGEQQMAAFVYCVKVLPPRTAIA